jgi:hypothetical protein
VGVITRPSGGYTPVNPITNSTKYQDDRNNGVKASSVKVDGDINKAFDVLSDHDTALGNHETRIEALEDSLVVTEFSDNDFRIVGSIDDTKKVAFDVDGLTSGSTRNITVPDADLTLVGVATTQTLSNKTVAASLPITGTSTAAASISLAEDTDNGTNKVTVTVPASIAADRTQTLQDASGTVALMYSGSIVQSVMSVVTEKVVGTATVPIDNSAPQASEGVQIATVTITPKFASSLLRVTANCSGASGAQGVMVAFVTRDDGTSAVAVGVDQGGADGQTVNIAIGHQEAAGSTTETTFRLFAGGQNGVAQFFVNGNSANRLFGATTKTSLKVEEIAA